MRIKCWGQVSGSEHDIKCIAKDHWRLGLHPPNRKLFHCSPDEVQAWTTGKGKAPEPVKIHTDLEKWFFMAEVIKFKDFNKEDSENAIRAAGKYRQGRN